MPPIHPIRSLPVARLRKRVPRLCAGVLAALLLLPGLLPAPQGAQAELTLEFSAETGRQIPVAIIPFNKEDMVPGGLNEVISADLQRSGLFRMVDPAGVVTSPYPADAGQLRLPDWRARKADDVLVGKLDWISEGKVEVRYQLVDIVTGQVRLSQSLVFQISQSRATAHRIADVIYQSLTGDRGIFSTKIAYVLRGGGRYQLKVADADTYNEQTVFTSKEPIISPRWSPDGTRMAYVSFELRKPVVVVQDLATGNRKAVAQFKGNNSAPAWSPDGKRLAVTLSRDGIAQIYTIWADGQETPRRVMTTRAIDTEACFTPDGQSLLFTSDRGGSPQIYKVPVDGGNAQRLTFVGNYNVSPRVSPDGHRMVFIQQNGASFRVIQQDLDTGQVQVLTDGPLDESPSFSPNGRLILYATRSDGRGALALVSIDGRARQKFKIQTGDVYEPAWGPLQ